MPFKYNPQDLEKKDYTPLPVGYYKFECVGAENKLSKAGNEMLVLNLKITDNSGKNNLLQFYVTHKGLYNLKDFWDSVGEPEMFKKLADNEDLSLYEGKVGVVKTKIDRRDYGEIVYLNAGVDHFVKREDQAKVLVLLDEKEKDVMPDDDLPF